MREIKFRAWNKENKFMVDSGIVNADITGYSRSKIHELMQYTGQVDMDGREIYEGDIVKVDNKVYEVQYSTRLAAYILTKDGLTAFRPTAIGVMEIIGNIYENGDLLK